jgi:predicted amidophosphoribosyltransferase
VSCGAFGSWCCATCRDKIEIVRTGPKDESLDGLVIAGFYHDPILRELIHGVKYDGATEFVMELGHVLRRVKQERTNPWPWAGENAMAIQPVIGSDARIRERGFDQAALIADLVREELVPWAHPVQLLTRTPTYSAQADLDPGPLRTANVHNTFHVASGVEIPSTVLLIDDVYTTGSTMRDAARALRGQGVAKIYGFAMAMGK